MKKLLAILLALAMVFCLAACEKDNDPDDTAPSSDPAQTEESNQPSTGETEGSEPSGPAPSESQEPTCTVYLPTEMTKTVKDENGERVWREVYTYDLQGNRITETHYQPDGTVGSVYTMEYNEKGKLVRKTSDSGYIYEYAYDCFGNQYETLSYGNTHTLELDHLGRAVKYDTDTFTYEEDMSSYTRYKYDSLGEVSELTQYLLDDQGHVVSTRRCHADGQLIYRTDYVYENGLMTQMIAYAMNSEDYVSTSHTYTYDVYGNMLTDTLDGNYYSGESVTVYTIGEITVLQSAAERLGQ